MHFHLEHLATTRTAEGQRAAEHRRAAHAVRADQGAVARLGRLLERFRPRPAAVPRQPRPASTGPAPVL